MPDLEDIFEEIFDFAKKFKKRQKAKKRKSEKRDKREHTKMDRGKVERSLSPRVDRLPLEGQPSQRQSASSVSVEQPAVDKIKNSLLRDYLQQAESYERGILTLVRDAPTEFNRTRIEDLSRYIDHWRRSLQSLIERVDQFQQNELLQNDLRDVPKAITRIESQITEDVPDQIANELRRTLSNRQQQLASLKKLEETMQWAEVKIESTVSMLGTIYSQALMSQSKGAVGNYRRLLAEIEEESLSLNDYVTTLKEVKFGEIA